MKNIILVIALCMAAALCGCGEKTELHCDSCGKLVFADADSNMDEDWIIYCRDCEEALFGDNPVVKEG